MHTGFAPMPDRLVGELDERLDLASRVMPYHQSFLDDYLKGILPHDLVLLSAPSGFGKTDLALWIATRNARQGKRVHYFALEAEPRELERRAKFQILSELVFGSNHERKFELNYTDWMIGACESIVRQFNAEADAQISSSLFKLQTYYRGRSFTAETLNREVSRVHETTDLIVIDHLHYIDEDAGENEARALGDTVKAIRDVSLLIGKPVILVAHLRKRDRRMKQVIAELDDVHGSSNVVKICTQAIVLERAVQIEAPKWYLAPTYVAILKDRRSGAPGLVAVQMYDRRAKAYRPEYTLGRINGQQWEAIDLNDRPRWAVNHKPMMGNGAT